MGEDDIAEREGAPWTRATWIAAAMLFAYVALAAAVAAAPDNAIDRALRSAIQHATSLDAVHRAASWLGYWPQCVVAPVLALVALLAFRARREAAYLAASMIGSFAIDRATKLVLFRERPHVASFDAFHAPSFPSGHVMEYVALFGFLAIAAAMRIRGRVLRYAAVAAATLLVLLVGPSRVYLDAHWPSDVLGGYLAGGAWLVLVAQLYRSSAANSRRFRGG